MNTAVPVDRIGEIRVFSSKSLFEPGVFGILSPKLLLPEGIRNRLSESQLNAIFTHELVHIRWRDNLTAACHMFVQAVFWFHPLVWWIGNRLIEERELACDEAVVQAGAEPEDYAQGILNVCKSYLESPLVCVSGITGADLKRRVVRIVTNQVSRRLDLGRKLLLTATGVFAVAAPVTFGLLHVSQAQAQTATANSPTNLAGTWQGTLSFNGHDLRLELKVDKSGDGWTGKMYSIDQSPQPFPVNTLTLQGGQVKFDIQRIGGTFDGKMSADGSTINGTWSQGPKPLDLVLKRVDPDAAWPIAEAPAPPKPMAPDAKLEFEVATIKPSKPDAPGKGFIVRGRRFSTLNTTLDDLFTFAYHVNVHQVVGMPEWATSQKFDLEAQPAAEGQPSNEQWLKMIQKLLADRFKLSYHEEKKELSVYALTLAKIGPKMTVDKDDPNGLPMLQFRGLGDLVAANADMDHFAGLLQEAVLDRPVVNQTNLPGKYDFQLKWTPDPTQFAGLGMKPPAPTNAPDAPPDLFGAVQQQLGLKLDSTRAPVNVFVIDHVQQPTAN